MTVHNRMPESWVLTRLGDVAEVQLGKMLDKGRPKGRPHRYLRNINVRWDAINTSDVLSMSFEDHELERFGIRDGDVLVCEGGEPGRAAVWNHGETDLKYQKALHRIRLPAPIDPRWVMWQLMLDVQTGRLARSFTGSTIAHLPREKLVEYELRVAPSQEQQRTVEAIDSYLTRLDDAVASLERVQAKLRGYRASVLKAAVEGRLVPTESSLARVEKRDYEPAEALLARILKERRRRWEEAELAKLKAAGKTPKDDTWKAKYEEPIAPDTSQLPNLPEGWCWASAEALCDGVESGTTPTKEHFSQAGTPFIKVYNLTLADGRLDFSINPSFVESRYEEERMSRSRTLPGDVLTNIVGPPLGKVSIVPDTFPIWNINQAIARFRPLRGLSGNYLSAFLRSLSCRQWLAGTAKTTTSQVNLSITNCRLLPIPLPPLAEQQRIVDRLEEFLSIATASISQTGHGLKRATRLRQAVLKWAFEGRLVDQNPTDEPADRLLARIRVERAVDVPTKKSRGRTAKGAA